MPKSPEIIKALDVMSKAIFGRSLSDCLEKKICVSCGGNAEVFETEIASKEYTISGMCQECQTKTFKEDWMDE